MRKEYRELFDGVHASRRLQAEVRNIVKNAENRRRRIPAAALLAAVLAAALAGTALAAVLGKVQIRLTDPDETNTVGSGYSGSIEYDMLPVESLSAAALERAGKMEESLENWTFASWAEAEDFLGLELESNPRLAQLPQVTRGGTGCTVSVIAQPATEETPGQPVFLFVNAAYQAEGCRVQETAVVTIQHAEGAAGQGGLGLGEQKGETHLEEYVTANGIEASIVVRETPLRIQGTKYSQDRTIYTAYFVRNHAAFALHITVHDPYDHPDAEHTLNTLKEILDGYE